MTKDSIHKPYPFRLSPSTVSTIFSTNKRMCRSSRMNPIKRERNINRMRCLLSGANPTTREEAYDYVLATVEITTELEMNSVKYDIDALFVTNEMARFKFPQGNKTAAAIHEWFKKIPQSITQLRRRSLVFPENDKQRYNVESPAVSH